MGVHILSEVLQQERGKVKLEQIFQSQKACYWNQIIGLDYHNLFLKKRHSVQEYIMHLDKQVTKNQVLSSSQSSKVDFLDAYPCSLHISLHAPSHPLSPSVHYTNSDMS